MLLKIEQHAFAIYKSMRPGEPKKGGGGGMFTWGRIGDSGTHRPIIEDSNDPNYDSEASLEYHDAYPFSQSSPSKPAYASSVPSSLTTDYWLFDCLSLKIETRAKVDEVFVQGTYSSFISWLRGLHRNKLHSHIFARAVQVTLDRTESEHDVAWGLLELLYTAKVFSPREIRRGFDRLYRNINEILIDAPNAAELILKLLSSTVEGKALGPSSVLRVPPRVYNLGSGAYVLRNIKIGETVVADSIEFISETKEKIIQLIKEYYATGVNEGVIEYLTEHKLYASLIVRKAVELALDRNNKERELCSRLIAEISGHCSPETLVEGFDDILWNSKELAIDVPEAVEVISKFLARAIVDDCLPANYIYEAELMQDENTELQILMNAYNLLRPKEAYTSLQSVWGPQASTIDDFKSIFKNIIHELFDSKDVRNAAECIKELGCKYYMHEFIKKIIEAVMDRSVEEERVVVELVKNMKSRGLIFEEQISIGVERTELNLPSLILDVPKAPEILARLKEELSRE